MQACLALGCCESCVCGLQAPNLGIGFGTAVVEHEHFVIQAHATVV